MRKVLVIAALAALAILLDSGMASAGRRCGGGRHHRGGRGGCGGGYARSCGGGCGGGGCGYGGGCGGGYGYGGYGGGWAGTGLGLGGYVLDTTAADTTATVVVELPADAKLTIDGEATSSTSATRVFQTPALEPGQTFHYTLQAQVERDGKVQSVTRRVEVRAGEQTRVSLTLPAATVAAR